MKHRHLFVMAFAMIGLALACENVERPATTTGERKSAEGPIRPSDGMPTDAPKAIDYVESCNIEQLNSEPASQQPLMLKKNEVLNLSGWVVDEASHKSPDHTYVVLQSAATKQQWSAAISGRVPRPDVAQARNSNLESGFTARLDTSAMPLDEYLVIMLFWQDGSSKICDNGRRVLIQQ